MVTHIVDQILSLLWILSRRVICIFDARSISCFCGYLYNDNWFRSSDPFARSLQYISRYTSWTVFRGVIVISYRDLIFEKKAGRLWLVAVGRATFHGKFSYPYFPQYLSYKLQSACITVSYILLVKSAHLTMHTSITTEKERSCEGISYARLIRLPVCPNKIVSYCESL